MKTVFLTLTLGSLIAWSIGHTQEPRDSRAHIDAAIDDFHAAAAQGDNARYLHHLTDDAVFLGTDEWERWPKEPVFRDYVDSRFQDGVGWAYRSVERNVQLDDERGVAWFDEVVQSVSNGGRFRGTGVVVNVDGEWKIAHYALSFLVFNEDWEAVLELSQRTRERKQQEAAER